MIVGMKRILHKLAVSGVCVVIGTAVLIVMLPYEIAFIWIVTGGPDYSIDLPGNYQLVRFYAGAVGMCDYKDELVLNPNVDGYAVVSKLVVGHVGPEGEIDSNWSKGYFIVNTGTRAVNQGLGKETWIKMLNKQGISHVPELRRPSKPILKSIYRRWISRER